MTIRGLGEGELGAIPLGSSNFQGDFKGLGVGRLGTMPLGFSDYNVWRIDGSKIYPVIEEDRNWEELHLVFHPDKSVIEAGIQDLDASVGKFDIVELPGGSFKVVDRSNGKAKHTLEPPYDRSPLRGKGDFFIEEYTESRKDQESKRYEIELNFVGDGAKSNEDHGSEPRREDGWHFTFADGEIFTDRIERGIERGRSTISESTTLTTILTQEEAAVVESSLNRQASAHVVEVPDGTNYARDSNSDGRNTVQIMPPLDFVVDLDWSSDEYIEAVNPGFGLSDDFFIGAMLYLPAPDEFPDGVSEGVVLAQREGGDLSDDGWEILVKDNSDIVKIDASDNSSITATKENVSDGSIHHIAIYFDGDQVKLYIDGKLAINWGTQAKDSDIFDHPVTIGARDGGGNPAATTAEKISIHSPIPSDDQIEDLSDGERVTDGEIMYLPCNDGLGSTLDDISGNENDGTIISDDVSSTWVQTEDEGVYSDVISKGEYVVTSFSSELINDAYQRVSLDLLPKH